MHYFVRFRSLGRAKSDAPLIKDLMHKKMNNNKKAFVIGSFLIVALTIPLTFFQGDVDLLIMGEQSFESFIDDSTVQARFDNRRIAGDDKDH